MSAGDDTHVQPLSLSTASLVIRPITLRAANAYVEQHHRHHKPARGCVFCNHVLLEPSEAGDA